MPSKINKDAFVTSLESGRPIKRAAALSASQYKKYYKKKGTRGSTKRKRTYTRKPAGTRLDARLLAASSAAISGQLMKLTPEITTFLAAHCSPFLDLSLQPLGRAGVPDLYQEATMGAQIIFRTNIVVPSSGNLSIACHGSPFADVLPVFWSSMIKDASAVSATYSLQTHTPGNGAGHNHRIAFPCSALLSQWHKAQKATRTDDFLQAFSNGAMEDYRVVGAGLKVRTVIGRDEAPGLINCGQFSTVKLLQETNTIQSYNYDAGSSWEHAGNTECSLLPPGFFHDMANNNHLYIDPGNAYQRMATLLEQSDIGVHEQDLRADLGCTVRYTEPNSDFAMVPWKSKRIFSSSTNTAPLPTGSASPAIGQVPFVNHTVVKMQSPAVVSDTSINKYYWSVTDATNHGMAAVTLPAFSTLTAASTGYPCVQDDLFYAEENVVIPDYAARFSRGMYCNLTNHPAGSQVVVECVWNLECKPSTKNMLAQTTPYPPSPDWHKLMILLSDHGKFPVIVEGNSFFDDIGEAVSSGIKIATGVVETGLKVAEGVHRAIGTGIKVGTGVLHGIKQVAKM